MTSSMPRAFNSSSALMYPGICLVDQVGVNAPGNPMRITFLPLVCSKRLTFAPPGQKSLSNWQSAESCFGAMIWWCWWWWWCWCCYGCSCCFGYLPMAECVGWYLYGACGIASRSVFDDHRGITLNSQQSINNQSMNH
mmetsp:Transcript_3150/g.7585  ORF Transcript_3150/g.7585 Transcript_3150/m.7585 type:complete len:138 (-) Transcript_3150:39-452(-)